MAETTTTVDKGRISETRGSEGLKALWATAAQLNEENAKLETPLAGTYVPWRAILLRSEILPRQTLDEDAIARYGESFDDLPPIKVQATTLVLIGGRHRLQATIPATRDHIRVIEVDVLDADLRRAAFEDNAEPWGVPMKLADRLLAAKWFSEENPDTSDQEVADWAGLSRDTVWRLRYPMRHPGEEPKANKPKPPKQQDTGAPAQQEKTTAPTSGGVGVPKPQTNGSGKPGAHPVFTFTFEPPDESVDLLAEQTPAELIDSRIDELNAAIGWMSDYVVALTTRRVSLQEAVAV